MKPGIKKGQKLTKEHRQAISRGHIGIHAGENNPNYKTDRRQIKVGVTTFSITEDIKEWLNLQPNKSKYIQGLIRKDMERNNFTKESDIYNGK